MTLTVPELPTRRVGDRAARWLAWIAAFIALIGVIEAWTGVVLGAASMTIVQPMVPSVGISIVLLALSILASVATPPRSVLARVSAAVALGISVVAIVFDVSAFARGSLRFSMVVDQVSPEHPAWPALNTALGLALIAAGLLLEPRRGPTGAARRRSIRGFAAGGLLVTLLALVGYAYGVDPLGGMPGHFSMAITTAIAMSALAAAVLFKSTGGDFTAVLAGRDAGAVLTRFALPASIILPLTLGLFKQIAERYGAVDSTLGTTVRTIAEVVIFVGLTLVAARRLRQVDLARDRALEEERHARASAQEAQALLEEQAQELEEQAQELEVTVDELRSANESIEMQRADADDARRAESEARGVLDAVLDQLPVGIVLARIPSGEIVRRNRVGADLVAALNRSNGADAGTDPVVWYRTDGTPYVPEDFPLHRTVRTLEVIELEEMTAQLADGYSAHLTVSAAPVYSDGAPTMAVAVFADMSSRRAAESALAERDALLASFFRAPDVMISVIEADVSDVALQQQPLDYRFLLTNWRAAAVLGATERDVVGRTASSLGIGPERRRSFLETLGEAHRGGKPVTIERPGISDGPEAPAWMSVVISPLPDHPGRLPRFCLIATDVSQRRHLEEELRRAQKLEAVGRLAGGIAHDFNNLLTAITGFTRFAIGDLPADSPVRADLEQALLAGERAASLTHQLLAFSRQQVLQPQMLDLNEVVATIEPMLRRVIGADIEIRRSLAASLSAVRADRGQLEQVIVNLVVNARDAMPNGGSVTIETANVPLDAAAASTLGAEPGEHVMLVVSDTGVGMTPDTRERIFEPFFTTKDTGQGTGLGLATVFGIVRQSGGTIAVETEPGEGTVFRIYLPRYDGPAETPRRSETASVQRASGRILLVEDDPAVRSIAARVLRRGGYEVTEAGTGREGLAAYETSGGAIDLVLTDLVLPEMGGRAMIRALIAAGRAVRVVYMSGYTADAMSAQSILGDGDRFLEKPFTPDVLLRTVREAIEGGRG